MSIGEAWDKEAEAMAMRENDRAAARSAASIAGGTFVPERTPFVSSVDHAVVMPREQAIAFEEYAACARDLAAATSAMKAAQMRFSAALQKLTAIVAPIEETK